MNCQKCDTTNPEGARFCQNCGEPLMRTCLNCDTVNAPEARFCYACGTRLEEAHGTGRASSLRVLQDAAPEGLQEKMRAAGAEITGERKPVTILFADIVGSTTIAEGMDPEEWREVVSGAHQRVGEAIYRYEGTIAQLLGDGVLAFFGAPITHEDDPVRAVHAALDIQASMQAYRRELDGVVEDFQMRIGINTGPVVIGDIGTDLHMEYLALGDAVNIAARLQSAAQPEKVLLSRDSARLVSSDFELNDLGEISAKGKTEPLYVYQVKGVKAKPGGRRGIPGMRASYVGRERDLELLETSLASLCRGHGQVVIVLGEAGIGKSRLVEEAQIQAGHEFDMTREELGGNSLLVPPSKLRWLEGRSLSYGGSLSFWAITQLLLADLGLSEGAPEVKIKVALRRRMNEMFGGEQTEVLPFLAGLMGLKLGEEEQERVSSLDGEDLRRKTLEAITSYFSRIAEDKPTVLVFEDLHWADPSSLEALEQLLALTDQAPLMVLCLMRVEREHGSWKVKLQAETDYPHRTTLIQLKRLTNSESSQLVDQLLGESGLPEDLQRLVMARSEGNPLYLEEVIRHLIEHRLIVQEGESWRTTQEISEMGIPDTLHGVLLARIDRLEEEVRRTLQMAAVIGRSFLYRLLEAISEAERQLDGHLAHLQRLDLVREKARLPELEYIFKHSLTQEAAYGSLLVERRVEFHRLVGLAMERLFEDHVEEFYGLLAHHWERAGDAEKAIHYLLRAGDQARLAYAHQETIDYYQRALGLLKEGEAYEEASRTLMKLGLTYHTIFDFRRSREAYDEAFVLRQRENSTAPADLPPAPHPFRRVRVEPITLDPTVYTDVISEFYINSIFSGLVALDAEQDVIPDVAQSWEISEDGHRYLFHLRDDVYWSDGIRVTAADFAYAFKRTLNPDSKASPGAASLLYDIKGAKAYHMREISNPDQVGVRVIDDLTLELELEGPASYFLQMLTSRYPVPRHVVEDYGETWTDLDNLVTNGPFLMESYQPGESLSLVRNPAYHGRFSGNLQSVELDFSVESRSFEELAMYETDDVDIVFLGEETYPARHRYIEEYISFPFPITWYVGFDTSRPPFDDPRVRQAFVMAVDREELADEVLNGIHYPATGGLVPPGTPGHSPGIALPYNPEQARQLLAQAGYPDGRDFPSRELVYNHSPNIIEYLKVQWCHNLNVEVAAEKREAVTLEGGSKHIFFMGWSPDYPDPDSFLRVCVRSRVPHWQNESYERLLEDARRTSNQSDRIPLYQAADKILIEEGAIMPLTYFRYHLLVKPWVKIPAGWSGLWIQKKDVILEPH